MLWNKFNRRGFDKQKKQAAKGFLFIIPSLIGTMIFILLPLLDVLRRSFLGAVNGRLVGFNNYFVIFKNEAYKLAISNTLRFTAISIPILLILSLMIAVILVNQDSYGHILKSVFLLPMAVPVASVVLIWKILFYKSGLVNSIFTYFGADKVDFMNTEYAFVILVISYIWKNIGYDILLWTAGLSGIPISYYEAAKVDGATKLQCFIKITIPNLVPTMYMVSVLSVLNSLKVFREAYLISGNYPHKSIYMIQHLMNNWFRDLSIDKMSAAAVINTLVIFVCMFMFKKLQGKYNSAD
jgi:ABC-type sugar transport systems, permease components